MTIFSPSYAGLSLTLRGIGVTANCGGAVWGEKVSAAVNSGSCNQLIRGLYGDDGQRMVGLVGILNMRDSLAAENAVAALSQEKLTGFIYPLQGVDSVSRFG